MNKSRVKVHGYSIGRLEYHCYNRGNYFVDVNGTTAKPNPNISVEECVCNETYFFTYVPKSRGSTIKSENFESRNQNKTMWSLQTWYK